jgi:hypothetical protein
MNRKIQTLARKLNIRDAGLLDLAMSDAARKTIFTPEQTERLKKIKKELKKG